MAQKNQDVAVAKKAKFKVWSVAIYIRLSREDGRHLDESESITNQRAIIEEHIAKFDDGDIYNIVKEYVDDGVSGTTDDDRAGFQEMLQDIRQGLVNCVIVKDLARSFRNYSDQGYYLDDWFPRNNVRFISLYHQPIDTYKEQYHLRNIMIPIQGVLNENHCAETSAKIREVFDMKRRKGEFIGAFSAYGYVKDPRNKNALIIDSEAAEVVKEIYQKFLEGMSLLRIARDLNEHGVLCPGMYKRKVLGLDYRNPKLEMTKRPLWSITTVRYILKNRIYCGDMVQGKQRIKSYKIHVQETVPEEDWYVVENVHEAIIDRETFMKVQMLMKKNTRTAPNEKRVYLFSGFLQCGDCGKTMIRSAVKNHVYYYCKTYKTQSKTACSKHNIRDEQLTEAVLQAIRQQVYLALDYEKAIDAMDKTPIMKRQIKKLTSLIAQKKQEIEKLTRYKREVYQDWKNGDLSFEDYKDMRSEYEQELDALNGLIERLEIEIESVEDSFREESPFLTAFKKYQNVTVITRELLIALVDHIEVYEGGNIKIVFNYADELQKLETYLQWDAELNWREEGDMDE